MILITFIGLFLGFFIPAIAGRFGKILPADPGLVLLSLFHKPVFPKTKNEARLNQLKAKWRKFFAYSFGWGIVNSVAFALAWNVFSNQALWFVLPFIYIVFLLMTVDKLYYLLPDFFTIPLLLLGISYALFVPHEITLKDAIIGAWFGYFVSVVAVLIMGIFKSPEFGAGDAKMLTALGAWVGFMGLSYIMLISFVIFFIESIIYKRNIGPYGPALGSASILVFFYMFM